MLGHAGASQIRVPAADGRKLLDFLALLAPVEKIGGSRTQLVVILSGRRFPYRNDAVKPGKGKRTQQHGIDRGESRGIGADPQSESNHRNRGETGTLPQHAQPVANILKQSSHY